MSPQQNDPPDTHPAVTAAEDVDGLIRERLRIDQKLTEKARNVAVIFTDIVASTKTYETKGDIAGRTMVHRHDDTLYPIVTEYQGAVIKSTGDGMLARFDDPVAAVKAMMAMQKAVVQVNQGKHQVDHLHVTIGGHYGLCFVEAKDTYGDAVNTAARVNSLAGDGQIFITEAMYQQVRHDPAIFCRFHEAAKVKGKAEPLNIYQVIWREEEQADKPRSAEGEVAETPRKALRLAVRISEGRIRASAVERLGAEEQTVRQVEEVAAAMPEVDELLNQLTGLLATVDDKGRLDKKKVARLVEYGQRLYQLLLPEGVRACLKETSVEDLVVSVDDQLIKVPWELLHDGETFLCLRFNMGRIVVTQRPVVDRRRQLRPPLKMLVAVDPSGDLSSAQAEGQLIKTGMDRVWGKIQCELWNKDITQERVKQHIEEYDLVHYAGHADYNQFNPSLSGWMLQDGKLITSDIVDLAQTVTLPALVFSNSCQSGQTSAWQADDLIKNRIHGLADAFLMSGVQHYVGAFWNVYDRPSADFAMEFYSGLVKGMPVGQALRQARLKIIERHGMGEAVWAGYILYGSPSTVYIKEIGEIPEERAQDKVRAIPLPIKKRVWPRVAVGVAAAIVLILVAIWFFKPSFSDRDEGYRALKTGNIALAEDRFKKLSTESGSAQAAGWEGLAAVRFQQGKYDEARQLAQQAFSVNAASPGANVVLGKLRLAEGQPGEAQKSFEIAAKTENAPSWVL
ncbi:MAG: CHAT domain-containing protein, partial [Deltaproteobacteria bacterium]|nr:CHAT domain-containing protein [Deltaproteobacteria bacterium]